MDKDGTVNHLLSFCSEVPGIISRSIFLTPPNMLSKNWSLSLHLYLPHTSDACV